MPSPFPGMDPWLESLLFFGGLHSSMIFLIKAALQARLPEPYYADTDDRVWIDYSLRYVEPDVNVLRRPLPTPRANGGAACVTRSQPIVVQQILVANDETRETFVNVYTRRDDTERLVTSIEILSPANKAPGGQGRLQYEKKQLEVLESPTHLVEIDLLRGGRHATAVTHDRLRERAGDYDYHVCVNQFDRRDEYLIYPFRLPDRLPEIAVPLLPDDGAVPLDLQVLLDQAYDVGPYRRRLDYAEMQPVPPLTPEQHEWAVQILRAKGLVPPASAPGPSPRDQS